MNRLITVIVLCLVLPLAVATSQVIAQEPVASPCADAGSPGDVVIDYEGHCILVEPEKGPVQGIIVERVENLDGATIEGIVVIRGEDGWYVAPKNFVTEVTDNFDAGVTDGYHITLEDVVLGAQG